MLLKVENLSVKLSGAQILNGVSFGIESGEGVSLIGPNGAGKTTVLRAILQLTDITSGSVLVDGKSAAVLRPRDLARVIGYVPQRIPLSFPYTVSQFVRMSRYSHEPSLWRAAPGEERAVEEALELSDTAALRDRTLQELSGGELQRVLLAGAIAQKPKILLLDEPAASLDPKYSKALQVLLRRLRTELSLAVVAVTHDLNAALRHSNRVIAMRKGGVFFDGTPSELLSDGKLEELYEIEFDRVAISGDSVPGVMPRV